MTFCIPTNNEQVSIAPYPHQNLMLSLFQILSTLIRMQWNITVVLFFLRFYFFIFGERGRGRDREGVKHQCVFASSTPHTGDLARNPSMSPDRDSNQRCFGSQVSTQSTEPHQPGHCSFDLHFPDDICGVPFHMFIFHWYIFFDEVSVKVFV